MLAALLEGVSQTCSRASPVVGHAAGCSDMMCQRPWVHGTDAIITQVQLTDSSHMTLWMIVVHQKELGVPCAYLPSDCGSEDLMLVPNNSQSTSGCQMEVSVQPSKHTPPPNFPNPLINRSCWRRQQAAESSLFKLCCLLEELHQICRH